MAENRSKMREYFISVHFNISIQSIFACCLWLQEAKRSDPTGALPLDPAGDFRSPGLFFCTPYQIMATALVGTKAVSHFLYIARRRT